MNVFCIVMFKFNYSVGDIKNYDLGEGIVCLGREVVVRGEGSGGKGGEKWGKRGREVGVRGEGSGECLPPLSTSSLYEQHLYLPRYLQILLSYSDMQLTLIFQRQLM